MRVGSGVAGAGTVNGWWLRAAHAEQIVYPRRSVRRRWAALQLHR